MGILDHCSLFKYTVYLLLADTSEISPNERFWKMELYLHFSNEIEKYTYKSLFLPNSN